jgi:serine/threonine protein kinase
VHEPAARSVSGAVSPGPLAGRDGFAPPQGPGELGRLGPYIIRKVLGSGGMGLVLEAEDPHLKRPVALKVMHATLAANPAFRQRFLHEAQAAAALDHEHIVTIYQAGEEHGVLFLAMQLLRGETLESRLRRDGSVPVAEVLRIGREIAEGLSAAHERGLVHRDIKPANIWLEAGRGRVKILDFGLVRSKGDGSPPLTGAGAVVGTPGYMAPEQARRSPLVDHRSDLFSLGAVLYRLCTDREPFLGDDSVATLFALASEQPAWPHEINPEVSPTLSRLVMWLLAKLPADRPPSARAVAEALTAIERDRQAVPLPLAQTAAEVRAEKNADRFAALLANQRGKRGAADRTWKGRVRDLILLIATVLLIGVVGAAIYELGKGFLHRTDGTPAAAPVTAP